MIRIKNVTKEFGKTKGVFDLSLEVEDEEVFALLGPAGSGKTTAIRLLMGFIAPMKGKCVINGKDTYKWSDNIQSFIGYLPGNGGLPKEMTGNKFIRLMGAMRGMKNLERAFELVDRFELDMDEKIRFMSKENRKKVQIISAFMHDPKMLVLDEPAVGLEPLMQERFIELMLEEKEKGKTIFMTSQVFDEVDRVCDRVGMIRDGNLVNISDIEALRADQRKNYIIKFADQQEVFRFMKEPYEVIQIKEKQIIVNVKGEMMSLIHTLNDYKVTNLEMTVQSLEEIFPHFYGGQLHV